MQNLLAVDVVQPHGDLNEPEVPQSPRLRHPRSQPKWESIDVDVVNGLEMTARGNDAIITFRTASGECTGVAGAPIHNLVLREGLVGIARAFDPVWSSRFHTR